MTSPCIHTAHDPRILTVPVGAPAVSAPQHADLERAICAAYDRIVSSQTPAEQRQAFDDMRALVAQRTPEAVERMEAERGLR